MRKVRPVGQNRTVPVARAASVPDPVPTARLERLPATAKGRAMRDRLVASAVECFAANGYHATAVADITAAAGTSHGNFYRYFDNVDAVLLAAVAPALDRLLDASRHPDPAEATDPAALQRWQQAFFATYAPDRVLLATMREAAAIDRAEGFTTAWRGLRGRFVHEIEVWIGDVTAALGPDPDGASAVEVAEVLGSMTEQLAYLNLGLVRAEPEPARLAELGRTAALAYHRTVVACRK